MSSQKHIIHRQVIEVEVPSVEGAWPIQNRLSDSYKYNLMQVLADVFDTIAGPDQILRIDKLEIDLGEMNSNTLEEEMSSRLREMMTEKLTQLKLKAEGRSGDNSSEEVSLRKRPVRYTATDFLFHFLRTGTAPWWHDREQFGTVKEVLHYLLEKRPDILRAFLPKLLRESTVRKRIAAVFDDIVIGKLVDVFKPAHSVFSLEILRQLTQRKIGIRISEKQFSATDPQKKKNQAEGISAILPLSEARSEWIGHLLLSVQQGNNDAIESFFKSYEIVSAAGSSIDRITELKRMALSAGINIETGSLSDTDDYFKQKSSVRKTKRIRRKRTRENLLTEEFNDEEELVSETDTNNDETEVGSADFLTDDESGDTSDETNLNQPKKKKDAFRKKKTARKKKTDLAGENEETFSSQDADELNETEVETRTEETVSFEMIHPEKKTAESDLVTEPDEQKEKEEFPVLLREEELSDFIVDNAGLVLVWPYLSFFFDALGMLRDRQFVNEAAAARAVHLLQYISDNGEFEYEEHDLVLNKILCGIEISQPIDMNFEITEAEKEEVEGLLQAVRDNWKAIGTTSVNGLRMSFIRKEGSLKKSDQGWTLQVERTTIDMLLDKLPWAISIVRLPWTKELLYVEW